MQEAGITFDLYLMKINFRVKNRHSGVTSSTILFPWFRGNKHISLNHVILLGIVPERFLYHVPLRVHRGVFWNISDPGGMKAFGVRKLPFVDYWDTNFVVTLVGVQRKEETVWGYVLGRGTIFILLRLFLGNLIIWLYSHPRSVTHITEYSATLPSRIIPGGVR